MNMNVNTEIELLVRLKYQIITYEEWLYPGWSHIYGIYGANIIENVKNRYYNGYVGKDGYELFKQVLIEELIKYEQSRT